MNRDLFIKIVRNNPDLTDDEILSMATDVFKTLDPVDARPAADPEPEEPEPAQPAADPEPAQPDYTGIIETAIKDGFKQLAETMQAAEITRSRLPEQNDDDILAQIISPKMKERDK